MSTPRLDEDLTMRLAALHVYPIKSCAGLALDRADVETRGLRHDRRWMVVDPQGRFVTGRQEGRMVLIRAEPDDDGLMLAAPEMSPLHVRIPDADAPRAEATVWQDCVDAVRAGDAADAWFSAYLGRPVHLLHFDAQSRRAVDPRYARPDDEVAFADGFPLLAISQASLDALNARIHAKHPASRPLSMARFRPNLVIAGTEAHSEDAWRYIRIGEVAFDVAKPCTRCVFTTIDPDTGERHVDGEPLTTLKDYRHTPAGITFGMNLIPRGQGTLRVGDEVSVVT
jgi:uncharacterized protein